MHKKTHRNIVKILLACIVFLIAGRLPAIEGTYEEQQVYEMLEEGKYIEARTLAEKIIENNPASYAGHYALGKALHYGEGNLPRAYMEMKTARRLYESMNTPFPGSNKPWRWHSSILLELAWIAGEMDLNEEKVDILKTFNLYYLPKQYAQISWPLMKLYRDEEAKQMIQLAFDTGDINQLEVGYNTLGALESERFNREEAYRIFTKLIEYLSTRGYFVSPVYYGNAGGAALGLLKFADAERLWQEGTRNFEYDTNTNPWFFLVDLYTLEGRYSEALDAIKQGIEWQQKQPSYKDQQKRAQIEGYIIRFLLATGQVDVALEKTSVLVKKPDRMGIISSSKEQFKAGMALLYRRSLLEKASMLREEMTYCSWKDYFINAFNIIRYRFHAWLKGRQAISKMMTSKRLYMTLSSYGEGSIVYPQWLLGDIIPLLGTGVFMKGIEDSRKFARYKPLEAYFTAMEAEATYFRGSHKDAEKRLSEAIKVLPAEEVLYKARLKAMLANIYERNGDNSAAVEYYSAIMRTDPAVLRRLEISLPVEVKGSDRIASMLYKSPRFKKSGNGFIIQIKGTEWDRSIELMDRNSNSVRTLHLKKPKDEKEASKLRIPMDSDKAAAALCNRELFAPPIDLSQASIFSLDGSPLSVNQDIWKNMEIMLKKENRDMNSSDKPLMRKRN
ncbi:MAG: hypothetical protein JXA60_00295 [Candidatus Coatesbacteria bacterium]|nr:hypothetical protein [Candidatus Coatesbacteria bacterium]